MDNVVAIMVNGVRHEIDVVPDATTALTARGINASLGAAGASSTIWCSEPPTDAQRKAAEEEMRADLITELRTYPEADLKAALAFLGRKGWGLEGLGTDDLSALAFMLWPVSEDD